MVRVSTCCKCGVLQPELITKTPSLARLDLHGKLLLDPDICDRETIRNCIMAATPSQFLSGDGSHNYSNDDTISGMEFILVYASEEIASIYNVYHEEQ